MDKHYLKKIDWKLFHLSAWMMLLMSYIMPFHHVGEIEIEIGYPLPFLFIHNIGNGALGWNPLSSVSVIIGPIFFNLAVIYAVLYWGRNLIHKIKARKSGT